ncbi:glycosyltransferase family 4 protein [Actinoplanes sp. M2I2]|uniref:glycosyltransferase family 4 protein n=1 Tax=Actinoplanes sp. M2I2 TaxID=1734444 RepID=UPI002021B5BF|nr:glycosyltransferase family 4 protein [Actinoplanes sp. M2I2]
MVRLLYSFPHVLDRPGIALTALSQIRGVAALGADVTLFCASVGSAVLPASVRVHETLALAGRRIPHRALGVQRAYTLHDRLTAWWLRGHAGDVDVVHAWPRGCLHTLRAAAAAGIPALRESPNAHTASVFRESEAAVRHAGVRLRGDHSHASDHAVLDREIAEYLSATRVLVPSSYAWREFVREGFPEDRLLRHRYGCDVQAFAPRPAQRPADRPFTAAFVGRGDATKGLHVALAAWRAAGLDNAELLVAGRVEDDYADVLRDGLADPSVRVLGFVSDVPSLLARADVLLLPSWTEGSALVTLEAQASGCVPLVSTACGPLGRPGLDYLEHDVADVATLAGQLTMLHRDPAELARLSARGTAQRSFLSWDEAGRALLDCYRQVI